MIKPVLKQIYNYKGIKVRSIWMKDNLISQINIQNLNQKRKIQRKVMMTQIMMKNIMKMMKMSMKKLIMKKIRMKRKIFQNLNNNKTTLNIITANKPNLSFLEKEVDPKVKL